MVGASVTRGRGAGGRITVESRGTLGCCWPVICSGVEGLEKSDRRGEGERVDPSLLLFPLAKLPPKRQWWARQREQTRTLLTGEPDTTARRGGRLRQLAQAHVQQCRVNQSSCVAVRRGTMTSNAQTVAFEKERQQRILALRAALQGAREAAEELKASISPPPKGPKQPKQRQYRSPGTDEPTRRSDRRS